MLKRLVLVLFLLAPAWARIPVSTIGHGKEPALAGGPAGQLHLVYESAGNHNDIFYRYFDGSKWGSEVNVSQSPGVSSQPALTLEEDGSIDLVWLDSRSGEDHPDIFFSRSQDGGKSFSPPVDVSETPGLSHSPSVAVGPGGGLHVVWADSSRHRDYPDVFYSFSFNHGQSWSRPELVSGATGVRGRPALAVSDQGQVHLAWAEGSARPRLCLRQGQSQAWSSIVRRGSGICSQPCWGIRKGLPALVWVEQSSREASPNVYYASRPSGLGQNVSQTSGTSRDPALAFGGERPLQVWIDTSAGESHPDVWAHLGRTFDLSHTPGVSRRPVVAWTGSRFAIIWEELDRGNCWLKLGWLAPGRRP